LLGQDGGFALPKCNLSVTVPHDDSARVQELHLLVIHSVIEAVEKALGH
jgi:D-sedoheptulose 7-phosphate isomerase